MARFRQLSVDFKIVSYGAEVLTVANGGISFVAMVWLTQIDKF